MKFIGKHLQSNRPQKLNSINTVSETVKVVETKDEKNVEEKKVVKKKKNKTNENKADMNTSEKIAMAQEILGDNQIKVIKSDKGLIERTESSKTILTEDNKELLID